MDDANSKLPRFRHGAHGVAGAIERARALRAARGMPNPIAADMIASQRFFERTGRRLTEIIGAWEELLPAELVAQSRIASYRGGVVNIVASSSSVLFEIDRLLRSGLEADLRQRVRGTVTRLRLTVGPVEDPAIGSQHSRNPRTAGGRRAATD